MGKLKKIKQAKPETLASQIIWALVYLFLIICVLVSSCFIFAKTYYAFFFVRGESMCPTLNKWGRVHERIDNIVCTKHEYGSVDRRPDLVNHLERFDVVITYYRTDTLEAKDWDATSFTVKEGAKSKIKRIIGFPNETVRIEEIKGRDEIFIDKGDTPSTKPLKLPFVPNNPNGCKNVTYTLKDDEYFVMGDNWGQSTDSTDANVLGIHKSLIKGVLISIDGYLYVEVNAPDGNDHIVKKVRYPQKRYFKQHGQQDYQ